MKYNTHQRREEGTRYLVSILPLLIIESNVFMRNGTYPLMFIGRVYNNLLIYFIELQCQTWMMVLWPKRLNLPTNDA